MPQTDGTTRDEPAPASGSTPAEPAVRVTDLEKKFGPLSVLRGITLSAEERSVMSIIGASGSGKSTLLRCLNLLEIPDHGELLIAGEQLRFERDQDSHAAASDRTKVAMVFQQFNLWPHLTVLGNVIEAPVHVLGMSKKEAIERGEAYLEKVGMSDKRDQYPAFLSGGQQQRAAIARALAMEPRVLLFDEPTSALDPELVGEVLRAIRGLADEGRTMVMVTHEMSFARDVSSQVVFLHNGLVEERGSPQHVFEHSDSERCRQFVSAVA